MLESSEFGVVHARTMDLGSWEDFELISKPPEDSDNLGYVGIYPKARHTDKIGIERGVAAGMNTAGLSCDMQTLINSKYPPKPTDKTGVFIGFFCDWALSTFETTGDVKNALLSTHSVYGPSVFAQHFSLRDADGKSIVIEFLDEETLIYDDHNDGKEGFGIMTNEPPYPWHVENVKHYEWKKSLAKPLLDAPGAFYPDHRFLRLHSLKGGLEEPKSHKDLIMNAVHLLNSVTIPPGSQYGTDSGDGEGEGDHTIFGVVYDHTSLTMYLRSYENQSLQRISLRELALQTPGAEKRYLPVVNSNAWYVDATGSFSAKK